MKILVLGASGMLGNAVLRLFSQTDGFCSYGAVRSSGILRFLPDRLHSTIITNVDVENHDSLINAFTIAKPDLVINCVGLIKQLAGSESPIASIPINALFPHRLARLCEVADARLVHMSTDCVFSGNKGMYTEQDISDANDLYGRSKYLGEVDYPHAITMRTSIIGHELNSEQSLIGWFLKQEGKVKGYRRAIFSGLPTVEIARIIRDFVIPRPELSGLYHVSAEPINKYELLKLVAHVYKKNIEIIPDDNFIIDRSLNSSIFRESTGYVPPSWKALINEMHKFG